MKESYFVCEKLDYRTLKIISMEFNSYSDASSFLDTFKDGYLYRESELVIVSFPSPH